MKHKQPCVTPPNELVAALTKSPMYCCAEWSELDPISQAQHKLGDTQEWRDYKEHCDYIAREQEHNALVEQTKKEIDPVKHKSLLELLNRDSKSH